jgi:hypothetical protein
MLFPAKLTKPIANSTLDVSAGAVSCSKSLDVPTPEAPVTREDVLRKRLSIIASSPRKEEPQLKTEWEDVVSSALSDLESSQSHKITGMPSGSAHERNVSISPVTGPVAAPVEPAVHYDSEGFETKESYVPPSADEQHKLAQRQKLWQTVCKPSDQLPLNYNRSKSSLQRHIREHGIPPPFRFQMWKFLAGVNEAKRAAERPYSYYKQMRAPVATEIQAIHLPATHATPCLTCWICR